jgi:nucleoside-diphosphate-sugar epimerase
MKLTQSPVLITGASGFIGANLLKFSDKNILKNPQIWDKHTMGTLLEKANREKQLNLLNPELVIHLAWSSTKKENYEKSLENLLWGELTVDFAKQCMKRNIRFITVGSPVEDTQNELMGRTPYAKAKKMIRKEFNSDILINHISYLKPSFIFSLEYQRPRLLRDLMNNREDVLRVIKNPSHIEEFIHIDDVIAGLIIIIENDLRGILELGGGINSSVSDFINTVSLNLGSEVIFPWTVPGFKSVQPNFLLQSFGWTAKTTTKFFHSELTP